MSSEKTEAPTPKRKQDAREEGRVAKSPEINSAAALLIGALLLQSFGSRMINDFQSIMINTLQLTPQREINSAWLKNIFIDSIDNVGISLAMILVGLLLTGVMASVVQTGLLFSTKRKFVDFGRVDPMKGLKRLFSAQGLVNLVKAILKLVVVVWVAYRFLIARAQELINLNQMDFRSAVTSWAELAVTLALRIGSVYMILAIVDYGYQKWEHSRSLKMTKEEIKEEAKMSEGDPKTRARIRSERRRRARMRMMAQVPQADVIITNPTHLAIAIQYDPDTMSAPVVLAKGAHKVAERIVGIARENSIPITQNIPLARAIYKNVEPGQEVPPDLYVAMAEVMAFVYRMRERTFQSKSSKPGRLVTTK